MEALKNEYALTESFLSQAATFSGLQQVLKSHLKTLDGLKLQETGKQAAAAATATAREAASTTSSLEEGKQGGAAPVPVPVPVSAPSRPAPTAPSALYVNLEDISWDQGSNSFDSPSVTVYVGLPNVIKSKDRVNCQFGRYSIDLTVMDHEGKNYRYVQTNLEKDIIPDQCQTLVKNNKIILKLAKVKGKYSYESWQNLVAKKKRDPVEDQKKGADPTGGIMDMMKNLYDEGDDSMKKIIGEAMLKSRSGEKVEPPEPPMGMDGGDF
jgi:calcyclin binding protein